MREDRKTSPPRVRKVLDCMNDVGLNLPILLDAVLWGNDYLVTDGKAKYE